MLEIAPFFGSPLADLIRRSGSAVIVGKGPTASDVAQDRGEDVRIALNDAWRLGGFSAAHFTDFDAFVRYVVSGYRGLDWVVLPFHPHFQNRPDPKRPLPEAIRRLGDRPTARVLTYTGSNASSGRYNPPKELGLPVPVRLFSAVVATHLVLRAGAGFIRFFGVDGGSSYAQEFSDMVPLTNGRTSFDGQREIIESAAASYGATVSFSKGKA